MRTKIKPFFNLIIIIFLTGSALINQTFAEEKTQAPQLVTQKSPDTTRIVISTSGPVKFDSHWSDNPYRLIVEFKSKNVVGRIDKEAVVNQGLIKKITASYFSGAKFKAIKTLTFELAQKVPYKIWQEGNTILLDIQAPLESPGFSVGAREIPLEVESNNAIKRLEAMDTALKQVIENQLTFEKFASEGTPKMPKIISKGQPEVVKYISTEPLKPKQSMIILVWLAGLLPISGLGFWLWRRHSSNKSRDIGDITERILELKLQLQAKDKLLEQEDIIRKTIEKTAIEKEKEFAQLQSELQEKNSRLKQEEIARQEKEGALQEKNKECEQLRDTYESLKEVLVRKGLAKELTSPEEKDKLWILGETPDRRISLRLALAKDFHNTVILKIELLGSLKQIKSFAENISSGGLCFDTKSELDEKNPLNLRLFFYGGRVPIMKVQGRIVWKKIIESSNYYGLCFDWLGEKEKLEINSYIESKGGRS